MTGKPHSSPNPRSKSAGERYDWVLRDDAPSLYLDRFVDDRFEPKIALPGNGTCWLRFCATESEARQIIAYSTATAYRLTSADELIRFGQNIPSAKLPELDWLPLAKQIQRKLPAAIYPDSIRETQQRQSDHAGTEIALQLELIPASQSTHRAPLPAEAILVQTRELCDWVDLASTTRLSQLAWVQVGEAALLIGRPIPPIAGKYFAKVGRVLVPAGKWWSPDLPISLVQRILDGCVECSQPLTHLWQADQTVLSIPSDQFETLTRAAVRACVKSIQ